MQTLGWILLMLALLALVVAIDEAWGSNDKG